ncbi:MAG: DNA topoisomerase III, partial [Muribaculaceae bacterium]|nr:DNA topoisomerase III [Muribaculaceae bacterium]
MILCITEKPSVAGDIARILKANVRRDGYYEGPDYCVTWTFGHLCTLKEPADYSPNWKPWSLSALPMIPPRFGIKVIADKGIEHQFNVIKSLIERCDEIINCGD